MIASLHILPCYYFRWKENWGKKEDISPLKREGGDISELDDDTCISKPHK